MPSSWPATAEELIALQERLGRQTPSPWHPEPGSLTVAGCFVCFVRGCLGPGGADDRGWAAAFAQRDGRPFGSASVAGTAGAAYAPGLLALREGPLLEAAVRGLPARPDVLLVNATGRDHPRRAGLVLHLGAVLDVPSIGVSHRPLYATGVWPRDETGSTSPLVLDGELVGYWLRTRRGRRPLAVHAGWRTDPDAAVAVVRTVIGAARTPQALRKARELARTARAAATAAAAAGGTGC